MYQSIPSLTIPQGDPPGFPHSSCPWGRVFTPLSCPGVLNQSAIFALSPALTQMSSSSFHMFIYARSEQCDLGPIYTMRIRIYPGKLKSFLVKISLDPVANMPKKAKLYSRFSLLRIYPDSPVHMSANTERIQICPVMM